MESPPRRSSRTHRAPHRLGDVSVPVVQKRSAPVIAKPTRVPTPVVQKTARVSTPVAILCGLPTQIVEKKLHYEGFIQDRIRYDVGTPVQIRNSFGDDSWFGIIEQVFQNMGNRKVFVQVKMLLQFQEIFGAEKDTCQLWYSDDIREYNSYSLSRPIHLHLISSKVEIAAAERVYSKKPHHYYIVRSYDQRLNSFETLRPYEDDQDTASPSPTTLQEHRKPATVFPLLPIRDDNDELDARLLGLWKESMPTLPGNGEFIQRIEMLCVQPCMQIGNGNNARHNMALDQLVRTGTFKTHVLDEFMLGKCYACQMSKLCTLAIVDGPQLGLIGTKCAARLEAVREFYKFIQSMRHDILTIADVISLRHQRLLVSIMREMDRAYTQ